MRNLLHSLVDSLMTDPDDPADMHPALRDPLRRHSLRMAIIVSLGGAAVTVAFLLVMLAGSGIGRLLGA